MRGGAGRAEDGTLLRRAARRARSQLAELVRERDARGGEVRFCLLGHRGHHRRHPPRARLHRPRRHPQVRGLLPRRGRPAPREGGLGRRDARAARLARRAARTSRSSRSPLPFNDLAAVEKLFAERGKSIAGVIVEPVVGNMGVLVPKPGFLAGPRRAVPRARRALHRRRGDDRLPRSRAGGACRRSTASQPDLVTFGKVIGGGLPVGAFGGRARRDGRRSRRPGPSTRRARSPGTRWRWRPGTATLRLMTAAAYEKLEAARGELADGLAGAARGRRRSRCR